MRTYICFFNSRQLTVEATTSLEAQQKAALMFGVGRRTWKVSVYLADVVHTAT